MSTVDLMEAKNMRDADWAIVDVLLEGRANAPYIAERTDYSPQYIRERLARLKQDHVVVPLGHGLYEIDEASIPDRP